MRMVLERTMVSEPTAPSSARTPARTSFSSASPRSRSLQYSRQQSKSWSLSLFLCLSQSPLTRTPAWTSFRRPRRGHGVCSLQGRKVSHGASLSLSFSLFFSIFHTTSSTPPCQYRALSVLSILLPRVEEQEHVPYHLDSTELYL